MKDEKLRCCDCGKFCLPYASAIPWGNPDDGEPPQPEFFCLKCFQKWEAAPRINAYWCPPVKTELTEIMPDESFEDTP